jgi:hypothetical protein
MPFSPVEHVVKPCPDGVDRPEDVDPHHLFGALNRDLHERAVMGYAGVRNKKVKASSFGDKSPYGRFNRPLVADVTREDNVVTWKGACKLV